MRLSVEVTATVGPFTLDAAFALAGSAALVGPNGCGKSTLLDCLAGLRRPDRGRIVFDGEVLFGDGTDLPPAKRRLGYVFQDGALFPHMTVAQNVTYPLRARRRRDPERVAMLLERLRLTSLADRLPSALSGGERQRAALARALAAEPRWLLLDEPFAALDPASRPLVREELGRLLDDLGVPAILVTHDRGEALAFGETVLVMEQGRVVDQGPPAALLASPSSAFGAALAGLNYYRGEVLDSADGMSRLQVGPAVLQVPGEHLPGSPLAVVVPPEDVMLARERPAISARNVLEVTVEAVSPDAAGLRVRLAGAVPVTAVVSPQAAAELALVPGTPVHALFKVGSVRVC